MHKLAEYYMISISLFHLIVFGVTVVFSSPRDNIHRVIYCFILGSQIIDMMLLVVDVVKGMQTQTAECLVIGEILCDRMIVVLNKIDLLPVEKRNASIEKVFNRYILVFSTYS